MLTRQTARIHHSKFLSYGGQFYVFTRLNGSDDRNLGHDIQRLNQIFFSNLNQNALLPQNSHKKFLFNFLIQKRSSQSRRTRNDSRFSNPPTGHALMLSVNNYTAAKRDKIFNQTISQLLCQTLLHLRTPREHFNNTRNF